jgi:hypothetical protein
MLDEVGFLDRRMLTYMLPVKERIAPPAAVGSLSGVPVDQMEEHEDPEERERGGTNVPFGAPDSR